MVNRQSFSAARARSRRHWRAASLLLILQVVPAAAVEPDELVDLSLEELGNIVITSVSKRPERIADAPASVYVISAEDIRRSGATILPEILRLAPNLQVARISSSEYAISSRGFNNATGNKLQVLLDGRVLYTPLFSGVFWDTQDTLLEDIERIEVISGAGATLWGANAVNGVINIITRSAADSTGSLLSAAVGSHEHDAAMRYDAGAVRFYGRAVDHDATTRIDGSRRPDQWRRAQVGFRADWGTPLEGQTLQGDLYGGNFDSSAVDDLEISGVNLLGRWNHQLSNGDGFQVQAYADHLVRDIPDSIRERLDVYDLQFQHDLKGIEGHALLWGAGYRVAIDDVRNATNIAFLPARRQLHWGHVFIQDSMRLADERFELTGGVRVSNNSYSGSEWMPSVRLAFKPAPAHLLWSALSRAVRTPSRLDRELYAPAQAPFLIAGGPDFESEISNTLDLGYRAQTTANSSLSITLYHHRYDQLRTFERTPAVSFVIANKMRGSGTGAEV